MSFEKNKILLKAFIESQFGYYPLTWVSHNREANSRMNNTHERALTGYNDNISSIEEVL